MEKLSSPFSPILPLHSNLETVEVDKQKLKRDRLIRITKFLTDSNQSTETVPANDTRSVKWNKSLLKKTDSLSTNTTENPLDRIHIIHTGVKIGLHQAIEQTTNFKNMTMSTSSLTIPLFSVDHIGLKMRLAKASLQTMAFHQLILKNLITSCPKKLEQIDLKLNFDLTLLAFKTLPPTQNALSQLENIDSSFFQLPQRQKHSLLDFSKVGASLINNYPLSVIPAAINCDACHVARHGDYAFSVLADGCGWGLKSQQAAQRATAAASLFISQSLVLSLQRIANAQQLVYMLLQALAFAHESIVRDKEEWQEAGTTTINICFAFTSETGEKYLMVAGVGDCKAFIVTKDEKGLYQAVEATSTKRLGFDAKDPGGRLGPYSSQKEDCIDPDLRNLAVSCFALPKDDFIILNMSDGVHDNLNPEQLGEEPYELDDHVSDTTKWTDLSSDKRLTLTLAYQNKLLSSLINTAMTQPEASLDTLCQSLTTYCQQTTAYGREFMDKNAGKKEPTSKKINPGKMDHCSVVAFKS